MITSPSSRLFSGFRRYTIRATLGTMLVLSVSSRLNSAPAQEEHKRKMPIVDKIAGGTNHQAFTGTVASLDLEQRVLEVSASESKTVEIFPIKKGFSVSTADGKKYKLAALIPGTSVMVYYDQKGDHRTVKQIVVLEAGAGEQKKKGTPPS
ncbi:MAG: hypothetical protein ABSB82_25045 [Terriglobia bacterium]|jgi:hypothetical protein